MCLITLISRNPESYMFHTPNIDITTLQAEAIGLPILQVVTRGKKEAELADLKKAIKLAIERFAIQGIVTGAIESIYQASRFQKICHELNMWCFNPLWKKDQIELLEELVEGGYEVVISGIFAYPLTEEWIGRTLTKTMICELEALYDKYQLNPSGEGGEIETTVLDAPFFRKRVVVDVKAVEAKMNAGTMIIEEAHIEEKVGVRGGECQGEEKKEEEKDEKREERRNRSTGRVGGERAPGRKKIGARRKERREERRDRSIGGVRGERGVGRKKMEARREERREGN